MAQLHARGPEPDRYADAQSQALELQRSLLGRLRGELPDSVAAQKAKAAAICYDLAEHHKRARRFEQVGCGASGNSVEVDRAAASTGLVLIVNKSEGQQQVSETPVPSSH